MEISNNNRGNRLSADFIDKLVFLTFAILVILALVFTYRSVYATNYQVEYISYTVEYGDSLFTIISDVNADYSGPYDIRDLIVILKDKNEKNTNVIKPGEELLVPKMIASH